MLANLDSYGGDVALVTATAPGVEGVTYWTSSTTAGGQTRWVDVPDWRAHQIPWAPHIDGAKRVADPTSAHRWNRTAASRWRALHRSARQIADRATDGGLSLLAWSWEYQGRGLLHKHVVLGVATPRERAAAQAYVDALAALRERHGFGYIDRGRKHSARDRRSLQIIPAGTAARYVAKYLSKRRADGSLELSETVTRPDVPPLVTYVARSLTARTGMTMRYLRWRRLAWVLKVDPLTGELLSSIVARTSGATGAADLIAALDRLAVP